MLQVGGAAKCPQDKGRNPALNRCAFGHLGRSGISTVCTRKGERMHGGVMFSVHNLSRVTDVHTWECGTDIRLRSPERPRVRECVSSLCGEEVNRFLLVRPAAPTAHPVTPCHTLSPSCHCCPSRPPSLRRRHAHRHSPSARVKLFLFLRTVRVSGSFNLWGKR